MASYMEAEYKNFLENKPYKYEVTEEMLKTMAQFKAKKAAIEANLKLLSQPFLT